MRVIVLSAPKIMWKCGCTFFSGGPTKVPFSDICGTAGICSVLSCCDVERLTSGLKNVCVEEPH